MANIQFDTVFVVIFAPANFLSMTNNQVVVVIPVYNTALSDNQMESLLRITYILKNYPITFVKPVDLDISSLTAQFPQLNTESFENHFFKGIAGYNRLMLTHGFYKRFAAYKYMLIAQLDAYVFRDELEAWCDKDYDYIGAPWLVRPLYHFFLFRFCSYLKRKYCERFHKPNSQITQNKIGNGGFSLRKIASHLQVTQELEPLIEHYLSKKHHIYHEDVFFAVEPNRNGLQFSYPTTIEALSFSFDKYPKWCYRLNHYRLPFGCHGWDKPKMYSFWKYFIFPGIQSKEVAQ